MKVLEEAISKHLIWAGGGVVIGNEEGILGHLPSQQPRAFLTTFKFALAIPSNWNNFDFPLWLLLIVQGPDQLLPPGTASPDPPCQNYLPPLLCSHSYSYFTHLSCEAHHIVPPPVFKSAFPQSVLLNRMGK